MSWHTVIELIQWATIYVACQLILVPVLMWHTKKNMGAVKAVFWSTVIFVVVLILCLDDVAGAQETECSRYFEIVAIDEDPDMNRAYQIRVTRWVQDNGTDGVCESFGRCVFDLIADSPAMALVEIVNPIDEWVPSVWRTITLTKAILLAGIDPYEEWAIASYGPGGPDHDD